MALRPVSEKLRIIGGFELSLAEFLGNRFDVSGQASIPTGVAFSPDGTQMFVIGESSDSVFQYSLSTGFDVSTGSFTGTSFDVSGQASVPTGVAFNPDGAQMFVIGKGSDSVFQYSLSTAFDLSTASFSGTSFDVSIQASNPQGVTFEPNGEEMFIIGKGSDSVFQYSLSTAFDLSTASFQNSFSVSGQESQPTGVAFSSEGTQMFVIGESVRSVFQYSLSTGFELSTASFSGTSFDVSTQTSTPQGVTFTPGGTGMFIIGDNSDSVFEYLVGRLTLQG